MNDFSLYENMDMPDPEFPIKANLCSNDKRSILFPNHWHEHIELLYFIKGNAVIECNQKAIEVSQGELIFVNSNELHKGESLSSSVEYYCIILNTSILFGQSQDKCQTKYISPITQNLTIFKNKISKNIKIMECIESILHEYAEKNAGYELEIKALLYHLIVLLMRHNYTEKHLTVSEYNLRAKNMERFNETFKYIEINYTEKITIKNCAQMLNITESHFCHLFKLITGKTLSNYVNYLRLKKAETLLKNTTLTITEIALTIGFNDIAYFTHLFKKHYKISPSMFRNEIVGTC